MGKHKFLQKFTIFVNVISSLNFDISCHTIVVIVNIITKMYPFLHPRKRISTKINAWKISFLLKICNAFCFAFLWSWVRAKLQVVRIAVVFYGFHHFFETREGGCKNPVIIRVSKHPVEIVVDPASCSFTPEELEEIVDIKTVENATENRPLADTIAQTKYIRDECIPANIDPKICFKGGDSAME
jgi:hypothetical protein